MRGALRWRGAVVGCGEQVLGERSWRLVAESRMGPLLVVVCRPGQNRGLCMGHVAEHGLVEKLVSHPPVEAFDERVLHRLFGGDVVPFDPALGGKS